VAARPPTSALIATNVFLAVLQRPAEISLGPERRILSINPRAGCSTMTEIAEEE
jgi:hypothetical protein